MNNTKKTLTLKPEGITMDYSDWADDARYTDVNLFFDKRDIQKIKAKCRSSGIFDYDSEENYGKIIVKICRRTLTFSKGSIWIPLQVGIEKVVDNENQIRVWLQAEDLISVRDN